MNSLLKKIKQKKLNNILRKIKRIFKPDWKILFDEYKDVSCIVVSVFKNDKLFLEVSISDCFISAEKKRGVYFFSPRNLLLLVRDQESPSHPRASVGLEE